MAKILLAGVDPLFSGKLSELLAGHRLTSTESIEAPDLVVVDVTRIEPEEIADAYPETPILLACMQLGRPVSIASSIARCSWRTQRI